MNLDLEAKREFRNNIREAAAIVETWPLWKQNILTNAGKPFVDTPRPIICTVDWQLTPQFGGER